MKRKKVIRTITKQPIEVKPTAVHSVLVKLEAICLLNNFKKAKKEKNKIVHFRGEKEAGSKSVAKFFYWSVLIQLISIAAINQLGSGGVLRVQTRLTIVKDSSRD